MPSYRVETALSNRAGCQATECKNNKIKIDKDELRLGVWVEYEERGSFMYKHWGCVSGFQILNLRQYLDPEGTGVYEWDKLDGYDDEGKGGLVGQPDLQEKVRRVIRQGFVDPEDFNGDPEMNVLGEKGLHTAATKRKIRQDKINRAEEFADQEAKIAALRAENAALMGSSTQRAYDPNVSEEDDDSDKPAPKKRAKVKKESDEKPKPKGRKKAVKEEPSDDMNDLDEVKPKAPAKGRKKAVKEEPSDDLNDPDVPAKPKAKAPTKKGRKKVVKDEPIEEDPNVQDAAERLVKDEPTEEDPNVSNFPEELDEAPPKKKAGRTKSVDSAALPTQPTHTRSTRSRTAPKK